MEERFSELLDFLCSGIKSKGEYKRVRDELLDHLILKYEDFIDMGYSEEDAFGKATEEFGDSEKIRHQLAKAHPYNPMTSARSAMGLIIVGFLLLSFKINLFTDMQLLTDFAGNLFMLTGMMCFAKNGGKMKTAFRLFFMQICLSAVNYAVGPFISSYTFIKAGVSLAINILSLAAWLVMIRAFEQLTAPFGNSTKIPYTANRILRVAIQAISIVGTISVFASGEEYISIDSAVFSIEFLVLSFLEIVFGIIMFVRIQKVLNQNEHDYKIEDSTNKKFKFSGIILASCVALTMICNSLYISMPAKSVPHEADNIEMSDKEYSSIIKKMKSYGEVSDLIEILPKSEIKKLENIVPFKSSSYSDIAPISLHGFEDEYEMTSYLFELKENETTQFRLINTIAYTSKKPFSSRMGFKWTVDGDIAYVNKSDFCMVYNKQTKEESKVFAKTFNSIIGSLENVEYYVTDKTILCVAKTIDTTQPDFIKSKVNIAKFKLPICGMQRNLSDVLNSDEFISNIFIDNTYTWEIDYDEYENEDNLGYIGGIGM